MDSIQNEDRDQLIAYSLLGFLTPARTRLLRSTFDSLRQIEQAPAGLLQGLLSLTPEQAELVKNPLKVLRDELEAWRGHAVTLADQDYPALLREIIDPPLTLFLRGRRSLLQESGVAVVGSRRATPYGLNAARHLAEGLARAGLVVVSGLARGIDAAAHQAALDAGGASIAVLGTGIDQIYPRSNARLFARLERDGLILTEFPPGSPPLPEHFPIRNRVISGLTLATLIVEASSRSGSLITARMAAEQGREVLAVPGPIFSSNSEGTHRLIQYGAKLVHDAQDILDELPGQRRLTAAARQEPPEDLREVLSALSLEKGVHIDSIAATMRQAPSQLAESLLQLELGGWIRTLPGSRYVRVR